jgi:hypothetical protein
MVAIIPNAQRIQELVAELDGIVPSDGAFVRFEQYGGGPDESCIVGNEIGALRFGIAMMKVPFSAPLAGESNLRNIATDGLVPESSTIQFDYFEAREAPDASPDTRGYLSFAVGYVLLAFIVAALAIGTIDILRWAAALVMS